MSEFSNWGLCAACYALFMLWPKSVSHPFSFLYNYLSLAEGKFYQKLLSLSLNFSSKMLPLPGCFPFILCFPIISPYFLLVGLLLQYSALFQFREVVKCYIHCIHRLMNSRHVMWWWHNWWHVMMAWIHGDIFHISNPMWGESISHWWIPHTRAMWTFDVFYAVS